MKQRGHGNFEFILWLLWAVFALGLAAWGALGLGLFRLLMFLLKG